MFLKGYLSLSLDEAGRIKLGHNLPRIWKKFKAAVADPGLNAYDNLIRGLNRFWRVRYPEEMVDKGMVATIGFGNGGSAPASPHGQPVYDLLVGPIDDVVRVICERSSFNMLFFTGGYNKHATEYLELENLAYLEYKKLHSP